MSILEIKKSGVGMKKAWNPENVNHAYEIIDAEEFRKIVEEVAEIIYSDSCQLPSDSFYCATKTETKLSEKAA